ncbi:MAG TPA: ABC transporter substrate-binding protein [Reyranella sp.]|jgi:iron complex transport system substrate-binding protein|nr:ABC transporter substrate-binding protein [Reyranella sp.]
MRLVSFAVMALAGLPLPALAQPLTVRDAFNREVRIETPPRRIIPIFASNTEIVTSLGLTDRIVGIEAYTRYPAEVLDRPLVGGRLGFSVDAVVALQPDLLVVTPSRQAANQLVDPMERLGIPVLVLLQRDVPEILANIRLVGKVAGVAERGDQVAGALQARLDKVGARLAGRKTPSVVMITGQVGNGLMLVARQGTYTGDAIVRSGGRFALAGTARLGQVSPEAILESDPDVLLWAGSERDLEKLTERPGWSDLRAVRTGHAFTVQRAEFLIPGPRTIDGIERLAARLHPPATP